MYVYCIFILKRKTKATELSHTDCLVFVMMYNDKDKNNSSCETRDRNYLQYHSESERTICKVSQ